MSKIVKNCQNQAKNRDCARGQNQNRKFVGLFGSPISASRTDSKNCQKWSKNWPKSGNSHTAVMKIVILSGFQDTKFLERQKRNRKC